VITSAITGCEVHEGFYKSIRNYCQINDAELLVLAQSDPAHNLNRKDLGYIDRILSKEYLITQDTALNSNLYISTIKLGAKQIDPITGLGRIGQRNGSFIYASPKQRLKMVATANNKLPRALMTTGAITHPDYSSTSYMSDRTAYIAENDHVIGALVVEIGDDVKYYFRQIQADIEDNGSFIDLGVKYSEDSAIPCRAEAVVLGDWHSGETDPTAIKAWQELSKVVDPKCVVIHDLFNGLSISHHEEKLKIRRAQLAAASKLSLREEINNLAKDLDVLAGMADQVVIAKSNHDLFLERYLQDGRYIADPQNHRLSLDLAAAMFDGIDPLSYAIEKTNLCSNLHNIRWLSEDEDFKVARIQLGQHGHRGANGAKGSIKSIEDAYGNSVSGHTHVPQILRNAWCVGTSSLLKLYYNKGPSSWCHASCVVYPNSSRQLILSINGDWCLDPSKK